ncbi:ABC transporter permease [Paenibacillus taichungensis]|uniref:ABC transporter permease n=1 Tax=Paenibacillus taichungensis TaxID=484184 RepID=A0A329R5Z1_9BACL|nr:ABC transporter permease [Paenibacillus taichungensis]RAW19306.1 ABC transporter permease [Paenibacillus taichungensis]
MFRIQSAIAALKNRWVISILLLIQFTYGLSTITGSVNIFYNLSYLNTQSILDLKSTYLVVPGKITNGFQKEKFNQEQVENLYTQLDHNPDVISYGTYYEDNIMLDPGMGPLNNTMVAELTKTNLGYNEPSISAIVMDQNYYQLLDLKLEPGQGFSAEDFNKNRNENVDVLVGSYFKKYYKIGDVINGQYKINGFLPDKYIVNNNTSNIYQKLDKAMFIPMSKDIYNDYNSMFTRLHLGTILSLRDGADLEKLTQTLRLPGNDVLLSLKNFGDEVRQNVRDNAFIEIPQLILGASFIIFSVIGIVVTTVVSIMIRKRELGIKLALGESKLGILGQISIENSIIGLTGAVLSLTHFLWKYNGLLRFSSEFNYASPLDYKLNGTILFFVFLVLFMIIMISSCIVYLFIRRLEPKSLIGGME